MAWRPDYATKAQLKARLGGYDAGDTSDDDAMDVVLAAASRAVDAFALRQFGATADGEVQYGKARWSRTRGRYVVDVPDLQAVTAVAIDTDRDGTFASSMASGWVLLPRSATIESRPFTELELTPEATYLPVDGDDVKVTGTWGWAAVPDAVVEATLLQASRLWADRGAPFGVAGSPEAGNELRLLERLHPDVPVILAAYRRRTGVVG